MRALEFIFEYTDDSYNKIERTLKSLFPSSSYEDSNMGLVFKDGSIITGGEYHGHTDMLRDASKKAGLYHLPKFNIDNDGNRAGNIYSKLGIMRYRRDFAKFSDLPPYPTKLQRNLTLQIAKEAHEAMDDFTLGKVHDYAFSVEYGMSGEDWSPKQVYNDIKKM